MSGEILISSEKSYSDCFTCGSCISRCFLAESYPEMNPRKLVHRLLTGRERELADSEFIWACTLCGRCTTGCPKGLEMDAIVRHLRGIAWQMGKAPERIVEGVKKALEFGNNTGLESAAFVDMAEWLAEELADEMEDLPEEGLSVPIDKEGADVLYIPNPREYTSNPNMFQTYMKFFTYTNTDWTISSRVFDITNWAYYLGDNQDALVLVRNLVEEARRLKVRTLLSTECGHGFKILRKEAEQWLGEPLGVEVLSVVELAHRYLEEGKLPVKPGSIEGTVTYHDPCNVGRKLGVFEQPRELIKAIADDFVELWPNREYSICCGGGGSVGQNTRMGQKKLEHALAKHDQIIRSGATVIATSCQNCLSQLGDLQSRYDMPLEVKSVIELLVESIET
ncbi:MAG: (Fe-S)-binding protein [Desulfomonile tiedjei]|uniref:(Fe-S)-binding protein n=1 Tax=Desulfomonile tiedjei TaxID=2358 RepID=A0A9D6Z0Y4_9BACT|nr:(Fe-S)-binding protein [Desulfomonile tiedjei]